VSPQNVLISTKGQVRITDFGVAKARGQVHAPTQTGEVKGKIAYMAPEQVTTKDIDRRADVFALGCVLYEATTGQRPFSGGDALATLYALLEQPLVPPSERLPGYPTDLEAIVLKALERNPQDRFQTSEELGRALEVWLVKGKQAVSDANVATLVNATLGDRIKIREREIEEAVSGIEAPTVVRPAPSEANTDPGAAATLGGSATPMPMSKSAPPKGGKRNLVLALAAGVLVVGGAFAMTRGSDGPEEPATENARPTPPPVAPAASVASPAAPAAEAATVEVTLRAEPASAAIFLDGVEYSNPHTVKVPRDTNPHKVVARAEGFVDSEREVVFDRDREVLIPLRERTSGGARKPVVRGSQGLKPASATVAPAPAAAPTPAADPGMPVVQKKMRTLDSENPFAPAPK
jgi:hypothetical protein